MARSGMMAGSAAVQRSGSETSLAPLRHYLARRSALELVVLDLLAVGGALVVVLPKALALDPFWVRTLLALSPGLLLLGRSLVLAVHIPSAFHLAQLDPTREIAGHPLLDEARSHTAVGFVVLTLALGGWIAAVGASALL